VRINHTFSESSWTSSVWFELSTSTSIRGDGTGIRGDWRVCRATSSINIPVSLVLVGVRGTNDVAKLSGKRGKVGGRRICSIIAIILGTSKAYS